MARLVLGLFLIALPVLELALLIKTGQVVGLWPTLAMVVGAGVLGAVIMSRQGMSVARRTREARAQGRPPGVFTPDEVTDPSHVVIERRIPMRMGKWRTLPPNVKPDTE